MAYFTERNVVKVKTFIFSCSFTRVPKPPVCALPTLLLGSMVCPPAQGLFRKRNMSFVKLVTSIPRIQFSSQGGSYPGVVAHFSVPHICYLIILFFAPWLPILDVKSSPSSMAQRVCGLYLT